MLGPVLVRGDEGQVDLGLGRCAQLPFGQLRGFLQPLQSHGILAQIDAFLFHEVIDEVINDPLVKVVATEMGVAVGGQNGENPIDDFQDGNIKRAAAKVEHRDGLFALALQTISQGCRRGFVDDALDLETGDLAGILGSLALAVVEVGGNGDDGFGHRLTQIFLGGFLQGAQNLSGNFRRRKLPVTGLDAHIAAGVLDHNVGHLGHLGRNLVEPPPHEAFDRIDRIGRVGDRLPFGKQPHQTLSVFIPGNDRRGRAIAFLVLDDLGFAAFHDGDHAVGRSQINPDYLTHVYLHSREFLKTKLLTGPITSGVPKIL